MNPLHASEITCYQRCPREHQHAWVTRRVPLVRPEALTRGTSVHRWLNAFWSGNAGLLSPDSKWVITTPKELLPTDPLMRALCLGYAAYYGQPHLEHVKVEVPWQAKLGDVECAGTLDAIGFEPYQYVEHPANEVIVEHKTTSSDISPGSPYWREVAVTLTQPSMYSRAVPGAKILWDALRKPAIERSMVPLKDADGKNIVLDSAGQRVRNTTGKKDWRATGDKDKGYVLQAREETDDELCARALALITENPEKYYQRQYIVRLEHEHAPFLRDIALVDQQRRAPEQPRNPSACYSFGRRCGYFSVCWESESLDNDAMFTDNTHGLPVEESAE